MNLPDALRKTLNRVKKTMTTPNDSLYSYTPSKALGIAATVVFSLLTLLHIFKLLQTRTYICNLFIVGGIYAFFPLPDPPFFPENSRYAEMNTHAYLYMH